MLIGNLIIRSSWVHDVIDDKYQKMIVSRDCSARKARTPGYEASKISIHVPSMLSAGDDASACYSSSFSSLGDSSDSAKSGKSSFISSEETPVRLPLVNKTSLG